VLINQRISSMLFVLACACATPAVAQIRSSTITGTVKDSTGALVPGAAVTVTNQDTNVDTALVTTEAGLFTAPYLPAGTYSVTVSIDGFAPFKQTGIVLETGQIVRVLAELKMSNVTETVEVAAVAAQLKTDSSTVDGAVGAKMIDTLPNITQNPLFYAMLQAGAVGRNAASDTSSNNSFGIGVDGRRQWSAIGVNGGRAFTNDIQLDGLPVMGGGYNEASVVPNTEGLQEVRVISNNFSAEYGRGQAIISMSTKSGTNSYHGQATYMGRHEALDANTFSNNATRIKKPEFRVNDYGGALGGPIIHDKLFFFSSYHQLRNNQTITMLQTVPTALERVGDFSKTLIRDENGNPVPAQIFDPFNVVQEGPDLYHRLPIPNARIPNPNAAALTMYSFYPLPNRTPDDVYNTNNYQKDILQTVRRQSSNNRVDYRAGQHSIYGSAGISYAEIVTPRPFGTSPFNGADGLRSDKNPYMQIGDAVVLGPSLVMDLRYGLSRINTKNFSGDKEGFNDYAAFGVPSNLVPLMLFPGYAPNVNPNGFTGGQGGGSNWSSLVSGNFNSKHEQQTSHSFVASITKSRGKWVHKVGTEFRNLLSNYADPEQGSVAFPSPFANAGGNFNFEYVTADGQVASLTRTNAQRGINAAAPLLGAGLWWIRPGANVTPAFSQKYFAVYSQNDWRASSKLTINLGLRWEVQPGPTERFNRMSSWDFTATNAFGTLGAIAFPNVDGYSRNLWDTTYDNWGPRVGAAYQLDSRTVIRGGYGVAYLPSNTGYFSGPTDYGSSNFSPGVTQLPYGTSPHGVPVGTFADPAPLAPALGANPDAPGVYGVGEARFDRHFKNGRVSQFNLFVERQIADKWLVSIGYSGAVSRDLFNRSYPIQNLQSLPPEVLNDWRNQYIASNGTLNPATQQVPNPFQPASGPLLPFSGILAGATIARQNTLFPYPLLVGSNAAVNRSGATADYHSLNLHVSRRFSGGLLMDASYTWSREIDNTDSVEDNQGFNAGGNAGATGNANYLKDPSVNRHIGFSDTPHRVVATALYELPFGPGHAFAVGNPALRAIVSGWQVGGTFLYQSGFPIPVTGANTGAALPRPNRVDGVPFELPANLQGWYDGKTTVTLPSGRRVTPPANTYFKYNPDAFAGAIVTTPNGRIVADQFWIGNAAIAYDDFRTDARVNVDMSLRRTLTLTQNVRLEVGLDAMNIFNHTQFNGAYTGNLGGTNTTQDPANGLIAGSGNANNFGTRNMNTFNPRQFVMRAALRF
jgi:trimeric autotransporter adhesin